MVILADDTKELHALIIKSADDMKKHGMKITVRNTNVMTFIDRDHESMQK